MSNLPLPIAAGAVLLVLLGVILLHHLRAGANAARRQRQRAPARDTAAYAYRYFNLRNGVGNCDGSVGGTSGDDSGRRGASGVDGGGGNC